MSLPVFTVQTFNQAVLKAAGAVFAQRVDIIPGNKVPAEMQKKIKDLTTATLADLQQAAKAKYPAAVALIDTDIEVSEFGPSFVSCLASATVLLKKVASQPVAIPMAQVQPQPMAQVQPQPIPEMSQPLFALPSQPMGSQGPMQPLILQPVASPVAAPVAAPVASPVAPPVPVAQPLPPPQGGKRKKSRSRTKRSRR